MLGKKVVVAQDIDICTGVTYTDYVYGKYVRTSSETHAIIAIPEGTCMVARSTPLVALHKIDCNAHAALREMVANAGVPAPLPRVHHRSHGEISPHDAGWASRCRRG